MKIEQKELADKLKQIKSAVPTKSNMKITGILFKNNMLIANNLELALTVALDVDTAEEFIIPKKAIDLILKLNAGIIDIYLDGEKVIIKSNSGISRFVTLTVSDFPKLDTSKDEVTPVECDGDELSKAINQVMYACNGQNQQNPVFSGILLDGDGKYLNIVACDGFKLAWNQIEFSHKIKVIIPKESLKKILSIDFDGNISLYMSGTKRAVIKLGDYTCYLRLIEGSFIDYRELFKEHPYKTSVSIKELIGSLSRTVSCIGEQKGVPVKLSINDSILNICVQSTVSEISEDIMLNEPAPNELKIGFNINYLVESIKAFNEDTVEIYYKDALSSVIMHGKTLKSITLPVRLKT
jgi:DNA polymerase-3 subunit beta